MSLIDSVYQLTMDNIPGIPGKVFTTEVIFLSPLNHFLNVFVLIQKITLVQCQDFSLHHQRRYYCDQSICQRHGEREGKKEREFHIGEVTWAKRSNIIFTSQIFKFQRYSNIHPVFLNIIYYYM